MAWGGEVPRVVPPTGLKGQLLFCSTHLWLRTAEPPVLPSLSGKHLGSQLPPSDSAAGIPVAGCTPGPCRRQPVAPLPSPPFVARPGDGGSPRHSLGLRGKLSGSPPAGRAALTVHVGEAAAKPDEEAPAAGPFVGHHPQQHPVAGGQDGPGAEGPAVTAQALRLQGRVSVEDLQVVVAAGRLGLQVEDAEGEHHHLALRHLQGRGRQLGSSQALGERGLAGVGRGGLP